MEEAVLFRLEKGVIRQGMDRRGAKHTEEQCTTAKEGSRFIHRISVLDWSLWVKPRRELGRFSPIPTIEYVLLRIAPQFKGDFASTAVQSGDAELRFCQVYNISELKNNVPGLQECRRFAGCFLLLFFPFCRFSIC